MSTNELSTPRAGRGRRSAAMLSVLATTLGAVLISTVSPATASARVVTETRTLYAKAGTMTQVSPSLPVWGYNETGLPAITKPSGPTLTVTQGSHVVIELHNQLAETTSLVIRGQSMPTDRVGVAPGATKSYEFDATQPGTFIYEAGSTANSLPKQHQVGMGLYGTLIVRPSSGTPYGSLREAVVLVSEIDPALNNAANPAAFDMRSFAPKYTLINGAVYPGTGNGSGAAIADLVTADPNSQLLLRYVNAGINYHSMSVLGANQRIVGDDGHALDQPYTVVAQTVGPGQTFDALVKVPNRPGTKLAVFDANLQLRNRNRRPAAAGATLSYGGAMAFVTIGGAGSPGDTVGPVSSNLVATGTTITANISDATTGGSNVTAAEYFIDVTTGLGTAFAVSTPAPSVSVAANFVSPLTPGNHTIYVRGRDAAGNWGPLVSVLYTNDNQGPASSGLSLTPNPTNGSVSVAVHATGSDVATGGSKVTAAEYTIDAGPAIPIVIPTASAAVTVSLDATIPFDAIPPADPGSVNSLLEGDHTISIRARDAANNWGAPASMTLKIDQTGPATSGVNVSPNPNGGNLGINSSTPAVRVTATAADTVSTLVRAEGFIDTVGADGTGFLFVPVDGVWNSASEPISVDIPLLTIGALAEGPHTIYVHAKDAAGNWGPTSSVVLTIDKHKPTIVSIVRADPNPALATSVSFTVTFSENVTGVTSGNFTLVRSVGLSAAAITSVTGTGATRTVTVGTNGAGGTLGLNLTSLVGIRNELGNTLAATGVPMVGEVYTVLPPPLYFSTFGNTAPSGVTGADDADIYLWNGSGFSRSIDASGAGSLGLPGGANVDGFDRIDATHFYMSFTGNVNVPGIGTVQDEDVVYYNGGVWSVFFNGTPASRGLSGSDVDAISIVGGTLYFSTDDNDQPTGVTGGGDDADIYSWNGSIFARVVDGSASLTLPGVADLDGLVFVDATHFYVSFNNNTAVPVLGTVQDEDVAYYNGSTWSIYFDGTAKGLTNNNHDVDAFDIP